MMRLKGCPRCRGDMYFEPSLEGVFWVCLQCGNAVEARLAEGLSPVPVPIPVAERALSGAGRRG